MYGDGHCGFRVVARLCDMSVDDYQMICYQLLAVLTGEDILFIIFN